MDELVKGGTGSVATTGAPTTQPSAASSARSTGARGRHWSRTNCWASSSGIIGSVGSSVALCVGRESRLDADVGRALAPVRAALPRFALPDRDGVLERV